MDLLFTMIIDAITQNVHSLEVMKLMNKTKCDGCDGKIPCKYCDVFYECECGSGEQWFEMHDYQGIYLGRCCVKCEKEFRDKYNPWVFEGYNQAFLDEYSGERIEPEEGW